MELAKYVVLLKTVELGSLTRAGEALGYTQSSVSHMIQSLEDEFGFLLLIRNKGGVTLTESGKLVLDHMNRVVQGNDALMRTVSDINGLKRGALRIGMFPSVAVEWLPHIIRRFQDGYPEIEIRLMEGDYSEIERWLLESRVDIGFLSGSISPKVEFLPLYEDEILAILPLGHPLAAGQTVSPAAYAGEDVIYPEPGLDGDIRRVLKSADVRPKIRFRVRGDEAIIAMVGEGLGIGMLPRLYLKTHSQNIAALPLYPRQFRTIGVGFSPLPGNKLITDAFLRCMKDWLRGIQPQ